jgi:hypothetical protein
LKGGAIRPVIDEKADRAGTGGYGGGLVGEAEFMEAPIDGSRGGSVGKVFAVVRFGVEDGGRDHLFPAPFADSRRFLERKVSPREFFGKKR